MYAVLAAMALMLSAFAGIGVAENDNNDNNDNNDQHCPDHGDNPKVEASGGQADETITVDGQEVRVVIDGDTVNFYDEDGNPISVEFCIKAAQDNSGPQEGNEGNVTWENAGGNTPNISYVVVYGIVDDDTDPDDDCPNGEDGSVGNISVVHADGSEDPAVNEPGDEHTVTATVTDADGNPCEDVDVRFEVSGDGNPTPDEGEGTTDADGEADFSFNNDEEGSNTVTACTMDDGSLPESCDEADHSASVTKNWDAGEPEVAFCRQQTVNLLDEALVLFEANEDGTPCVTEDGSLLNEDQIKLVRSETNEDGTSATGEVVGLGGPGDPGNISVVGTHTDCDEQDAYVLLLSDGDGEELLRLSGEGDPLPNLAMDDENGIFFTRTSGEEGQGGTAEAVAVTLQGMDLVVLSGAESRC